ncbi:piRNA biogenesis protein EXD1 [Chionoecetes opilio]|uniref:PiRNA biogenesis protein EXD1 n=1 Tax=Chionoecetes opilio TaxID=41210 RepID=A0A8J8W9F8_CHIOP|nr:piRNA biogenesis protein EXD1 [Chionoecetes opilio]
MDNSPPVADRNANGETKICSRNLPAKTPTSVEAEVPSPLHAETETNQVSLSAASPFHAMLRDPTISSNSHEGRDFTLEEILELGDDCLGLKVLLTANNGSCLGVINIILTACRKITLEKVSNPNTGKRKLGLRTFFFHDVLNIKVLGEDQEARQRLLKDIYFEKQQGKKLLRKKLLPIDLQEQCRNHIPLDSEEVMPGLMQQLVCEETPTEKLSPPPPPPLGKLPRPTKWVIIDVMDDAYQKALSMICKEMVISLGMAGLGLGRSGTLVWLSMATSNMIFHFDVAKIGASEVMKGGLGTVLQDVRVVKVVHDCRALEDLLHHQLSLNLNNVFDTQAAEIYLHLLSHQGAVPLLVSALPSLLAKYLHLAPHHLAPGGQKHSQIPESFWLERPLAEHLGERLARDVMYLREVRVEQLDMMLVDLRQITEVYLGAMRDKDSLTVSQSPDPHCPWCRNVSETIEHFLLQCPRFHSHRVVLRSQLLTLNVARHL